MRAGRRRSALLVVALLGATLCSLLSEVGRAQSAPADPAAAAAPAPAAHRASVTQGLDCSACHTPDGWKSVGDASGTTGFDHSNTGFPLKQRHRLVACTGCHRADRKLTRQCAGCHQDEHQGRLGSGCDGCHSAASWAQTEAIARHRQTRLPLTGMHALTECRDCHQRTSERAWTSPPADCFACHAADYRRVDVHPPHVGVPGDPNNPPFSRNCTECHRPSGWVPAFVDSTLVADGFTPTGSATLALRGGPARATAASRAAHERVFPIASGPHRGADCRSCHVTPAAPRAVRCTGCHAHGESTMHRRHQGVLGYGSACLTCHPGGRPR